MTALAQWTTLIGIGDYMLLLGDTFVNLGTTQEGSVLKISAKTVDLTAHRQGDTPYAIRRVGVEVSVEAILLQEDFTNLASVLGGVMSTSVVDLDPRVANITLSKLTLRPAGETANTYDIIIWQAAPVPNCEVAIANDKQRGYKVTFRGVIKENADGTVQLLRIGDPDVAPTKAYFPQA